MTLNYDDKKQLFKPGINNWFPYIYIYWLVFLFKQPCGRDQKSELHRLKKKNETMICQTWPL